MQIQAYLDNVFDVGGLLEDAETKNAALEKVDELEEHLSHVSAPPSLDHQHCSLWPFMRLLWFASYVLNSAVSTRQSEISSVFAFHKWCRIIIGWRMLENTVCETVLLLFLCWPSHSAQLPLYPTLLCKDLLHMERSWAALTSFLEFHNKLCSHGAGMMREDEGEDFW